MVVTPRSLLSGLAAGKLTGDVEVAGVACVLLEQVEQDPLKGGGIRSVPPVARLANLSEVVGFNDGPGARRLGVQRRHQPVECLAGSDVPDRKSTRLNSSH